MTPAAFGAGIMTPRLPPERRSYRVVRGGNLKHRDRRTALRAMGGREREATRRQCLRMTDCVVLVRHGLPLSVSH
jgi:hypothetical protein